MALKWKSVSVFVLCASAMLMAVHPAYAVTGNISVKIDGVTLTWATFLNCNSQLTCFNIAGTYNGLTVGPVFVGSGQSAYSRVNTPSADSSSDSLQITNTRITNPTGSDKTFSIEIQQQDSPLPANATWWYNTYLNGIFGPVNGNSIEAKPYVDVASDASWVEAWSTLRPFPSRVVTDCPQPCSTAILSSSTLKTGAQINPLAGNRSVKIVFNITLKSGSYVDLNSGGKIITNTNPPDELPPPPPLSAWCMTTNSTAKTFGCPSCMTQDGQVAANAKVKLFASTNKENLAGDMARGEGEYLASLATLFHIPAHEQPDFFSNAQEEYRALNGQQDPAVERVVAALQERTKTYHTSAAGY